MSRPTKRWLRRNGISRVPYNNITPPERDNHFVSVIHKDLTIQSTRSFAKEAQDDKTQFLFPVHCFLFPVSGCHAVPRTIVGRDWRCRIFPLTRVYRASNPPLCVVVVIGGLRGKNIAGTPMSQPPQYTASPVQMSRPTKRWLRRNGTSRVPYNNITPPERDNHFVSVIHKDLTIQSTISFAKEAQDDKTCSLFPAPCLHPGPTPPITMHIAFQIKIHSH
jgi:hypothetical protein